MKKVYVIAAVVALIVAIAAYLFGMSVMNSRKQERAESKIIVAAADIEEGAIVTEDMLTIASIPKKAVLVGTYTKKEDIVNKIADTAIFKNEQITSNRVAEPGSQSFDKLSYKLEEGYRAVTITVDDPRSVAGFARGGDKVDILYTIQTGKILPNLVMEATTEMLLQNCEVLAVGTYAENNSETGAAAYTTVTLKLKIEDAMKLVTYHVSVSAEDKNSTQETAQGLLTLALRNKDDEGTTDLVIRNVN